MRSQGCAEDLQTAGCDLTQTEQTNPACQCGTACARQFQFTSRQQCEAALLKAAKSSLDNREMLEPCRADSVTLIGPDL